MFKHKITFFSDSMSIRALQWEFFWPMKDAHWILFTRIFSYKENLEEERIYRNAEFVQEYIMSLLSQQW